MRKTAVVTITAEGRDAQKSFLITEMAAEQAEFWAVRALLALAKSGVEVPDDIMYRGMAGVAAMGIRAFGGISWADAKPLLDEVFGCIAFLPNPATPQTVITGPLVSSQIEEVSTRLRLREEVLSLHLGFSIAAKFSELRTKAALASQASLNTETSPDP